MTAFVRPLRDDMTVKGRISWILGDASRRPASSAPFAYYYGYFTARAETV
jgi:hypothetical protein